MPALCLGLMSGTSMDGVDAALCEFENGRFTRVTYTYSRRYPEPLRERLLWLQREEPAISSTQFCQLDNAVASCFADAAKELLLRSEIASSEVTAVGSHGQTVFHDPASVQSSLQLGNPSLIAAATGITTVADFRRADIARGGQGAPLVPAFHHAVFAHGEEPRCIVNIGGIANITVLPNTAVECVRGFDTGPGNGLMDEWIERHRRLAFDDNGSWARSGRLNAALLDALLRDDYFRAPPPKSTGRNYFTQAWMHQRYAELDDLEPADVQRSLCELSARSIAHAVTEHARGTQRVLLCGGGVRNEFLRERLADLLPGIALGVTDDYGLSADWVESAAFAWLAMRTIDGMPGNLPAVTGAHQSAVLGGIFRA